MSEFQLWCRAFVMSLSVTGIAADIVGDPLPVATLFATAFGVACFVLGFSGRRP